MSQPSPTDQPISATSLITQWRLQILNNLLWVLAVFGGLALIIGSWSDYLTLGNRAWPYITVYALTYGIVVGAAALRQLSLNIRAILMLSVLGASSTFLLIFFGLVGSGRLLWIGVIVLALVYFGLRGGIITLAISFITLVIAAALYISGNVGLEVTDVVTVQDSIEEWSGSIFLYPAIVLLIIVPFNTLVRRLERLAHQATAEAARARLNAQRAAEQAQQLEQQATQLQATERMLRDLVQSLETPTVEIGQDVMLAPIVGHIDSERTSKLTQRLLEVVSSHRIKLMVIDVAGVPTFDTTAAQSLIQTIRALRLIGCETILTGISPTAAQTITALGIDMSTINTARSPQDVLIRLSLQ